MLSNLSEICRVLATNIFFLDNQKPIMDLLSIDYVHYICLIVTLV